MSTSDLLPIHGHIPPTNLLRSLPRRTHRSIDGAVASCCRSHRPGASRRLSAKPENVPLPTSSRRNCSPIPTICGANVSKLMSEIKVPSNVKFGKRPAEAWCAVADQRGLLACSRVTAATTPCGRFAAGFFEPVGEHGFGVIGVAHWSGSISSRRGSSSCRRSSSSRR